MMPRFRRAVREDCAAMAPHLREADRDECLAHGYSPIRALLEGFDTSTICIALVDDQDVPFAIYGAGPVPDAPGAGGPWMLGTDGIKEHWVWFARNSPEIIRSLHAEYPLLFNYVDTRNTLHIRWLKWVGFTFGAVTPLGPQSLPFQFFHRTI